MRAIWTEENKLSLWLDIEEFASESLVTQGVVPKKDFLKIQKGCQAWKGDTAGLVARQRELEKVLNHDVIAFTTAVTERIIPTRVGFVSNEWRYAPGDPVGAHKMRVYLDGQLVKEFSFEIQDGPGSRRGPRDEGGTGSRV